MGSIAEKLGPMPDATTRLEGIFDWCGTWFRTPEFAGCLFEHALAEFGDTWSEVTDVAVRYRDDLLVMMETLPKDVVPANTARRLAGVYVMRLAGVTADARAIGDPSAASQAWHAAETLLYQARAATEVV